MGRDDVPGGAGVEHACGAGAVDALVGEVGGDLAESLGEELGY